MLNERDFFLKTDSEIARAISDKRKYFYLISILLPCSPAEFKKRYSQFQIEIRACRGCKPIKHDVIMTLTP
jgi:hypothetical protein